MNIFASSRRHCSSLAARPGPVRNARFWRRGTVASPGDRFPWRATHWLVRLPVTVVTVRQRQIYHLHPASRHDGPKNPDRIHGTRRKFVNKWAAGGEKGFQRFKEKYQKRGWRHFARREILGIETAPVKRPRLVSHCVYVNQNFNVDISPSTCPAKMLRHGIIPCRKATPSASQRGNIYAMTAKSPLHILFFSTASPSTYHWLDRIPALRDWLDEQNRRWWIQGLVTARCRQHHQLEGRQELLQHSVQTEFARLRAKHKDRIVDSRSQTHLTTGCLALATHKTLLPFLRDETLVLDIIREHMGSQTAPALVLLMKLTSWLQRDPYGTMVTRLRGLSLDYGKGFTTSLDIGPRRSELVIKSCFYKQLMDSEDTPQLAQCCCCSQDRMWLEEAPHHGVTAGLAQCQALGDSQCCFWVEKVT